MLARRRSSPSPAAFLIRLIQLLLLISLSSLAHASIGDRLPEFRECVQICERENCGPDKPPTPIPFHRRLLLWTCPHECDYTCQHIITARRLASAPPQPVVQFHGKWPFRRLLGLQEPFSVLCSAGNLAVHVDGLTRQIRARIPPSYGLRPYYEALAAVAIAAWSASLVFHARDFALTERLDYLAAGANVLYGLYYAPLRIWRLDSRGREGMRRAWTAVCMVAYVAHVVYLVGGGRRFDYSYNMAANVGVGMVHNILWSWFSWRRYRGCRRGWATWPGVVVAWVLVALSMELLDFAPLWGVVDAHSLWHLATIAPAVLWYEFLVKDALDDIATSERLKQ